MIKSYNNSKHRTIGITPIQANENPDSVQLKQRKFVDHKIKFKIGDVVHISTQKATFEKGYLPNWSCK